MTEYLLLFVGTVLVNNFVLVKFLGLCPFLGVSKKLESAIGMGMATTFVMTLASVSAWVINTFILVPLDLVYLRTLSFILVIAVVVQFTEMVVRKTSPALYRLLGIFLPLITTNCAVLGVALLNVNLGCNFCSPPCTASAPPPVSRWSWCCLPPFANVWRSPTCRRRSAAPRSH